MAHTQGTHRGVNIMNTVASTPSPIKPPTIARHSFVGNSQMMVSTTAPIPQAAEKNGHEAYADG